MNRTQIVEVQYRVDTLYRSRQGMSKVQYSMSCIYCSRFLFPYDVCVCTRSQVKLPLLDSHTLLQPRKDHFSPNVLDFYSSALINEGQQLRLTTSSFPTHDIPKNSPIRFGRLSSVSNFLSEEDKKKTRRGRTNTNNLKHSFNLHTLVPPRS